MITLLGRHMLHRQVAVSATTFLAVLARLDVSVDAARSTLTRMVQRGYLERHRRGRQAYFSLSPFSQRLLNEGEGRVFESPVRTTTEQQWTLLSFSIPERERNHRHSLRAALSWRGFGLLRNGLWLAPGAVDVAEIIDALGLRERIDVFVGVPAPPTDMARIVDEAWDLEAVRAGYDAFLRRWPARTSERHGDLATQLRLITEWRLLLLDDPQLPRDYLPEHWPAEAAYERFRSLHDQVSAGAAAEFEDLLDAIDVPGGTGAAEPDR